MTRVRVSICMNSSTLESLGQLQRHKIIESQRHVSMSAVVEELIMEALSQR